jgi:hypothetical protein
MVSGGCDSSSPDPFVPSGPDPVENGEVRVLRPLEDVQVYEDSQPTKRIALDLYFENSEGHAVSFTVRSEGEAVQAVVSGERKESLEVVPVSAGEARVVVTARDQFDQEVSGGFTVRVLSACPQAQDSREHDYFPLEAGRTWTYEYLSSFEDRDQASSTQGTLTLDFLEAGSCEGGTQTFRVRRSVEGTVSGYTPLGSYSEPVETSEVVTITQRHNEISGLTRLPFERYYINSADTVVVRRDVEPYNNLDNLGNTIWLADEVGVVKYKWSPPSSGSAPRYFERWVLTTVEP